VSGALDRVSDPADDAIHYEPTAGFFEWWYFDACFDNGYHIIFELFSSMWNEVVASPKAAIHVHAPHGKNITVVETYDVSQLEASGARCELRVGAHFVRESNGSYEIRWRCQDVAIELTWETQAAGWLPGTGALFSDQTTGKHLNWVIPVPRARVNGQLHLQGASFFVKGLGYHDHNWGNTSMNRAFSGWYWGRAFISDYTVVYADVIAGKGDSALHVSPCLVVCGGKRILVTDTITVVPGDVVHDPILKIFYPRRVEVFFRREDLPGRLVLQASDIWERGVFPGRMIRHPLLRKMGEVIFWRTRGFPKLSTAVGRWMEQWVHLKVLADCQMYISCSGCEEVLSGTAIHEITLLS
jgi:hypothetical protein